MWTLLIDVAARVRWQRGVQRLQRRLSPGCLNLVAIGDQDGVPLAHPILCARSTHARMRAAESRHARRETVGRLPRSGGVVDLS